MNPPPRTACVCAGDGGLAVAGRGRDVDDVTAAGPSGQCDELAEGDCLPGGGCGRVVDDVTAAAHSFRCFFNCSQISTFIRAASLTHGTLHSFATCPYPWQV